MAFDRKAALNPSAAKTEERVYVDHYSDPIVDSRLFDAIHSACALGVSECTKRPSIPFPQLLFKMLEQASSEGFDTIVSWATHGRAFRIHDEEKFEEIVLPK